MEIQKLLLDIFGGNPYHAVGKLRTGGGMWYDLVEKPIDENLLLQHLEGSVVLGSYPILTDNTVRWLGWDIDSAGDIQLARKICTQILGRISYLPYAVEYSGNKGYHVFLFLSEPMSASQAKEVAEWVRDIEKLPKSGNPHVEVYPKQGFLGDSTDQRKAVGNLLKIPLGLHLLSHNRSCFVNPDNGWEEGPLLSPEEVLQYRVTPDEVLEIRESDSASIERLVKAIASEWVETKRHDIALYLSGYLAQIGWSYEDTLDLIKTVCSLSHDPEPSNRALAVRDTYRKIARNEQVAGFQRLSQILSGAVMRTITEDAPTLKCPEISRRIDAIRFDKGATWDKERKIAELVWGWLTDRESGGRILRVKNGTNSVKIYWYSQEKKTVVDVESEFFHDVLYQVFRLNIAEPFVERILSLLVLKSRTSGENVDLYRRSVYKDEKLYVNTGGVEVYVLDGKNDPIVIPNGTDGIFFYANNEKAPKPDLDKPIDVWKTLVDTINFAPADNVNLDPEGQKELLKAWILSFFFRNTMPTRPLLTLLGVPGSGKTTAIRQILRLIEGLDKNVTDLAEDKQDSWRAALETSNIIVLDNLEETRSRWLASSLDKIATGASISLRKLYTTNVEYEINSDVFVALTAVSMPFSKETVFERMLVLNTDKLRSFRPSYLIEQELVENINGVWGDLLLKLNRVVASMNKNKRVVLAMEIRMADFGLFCKRIQDSGVVDADIMNRGIRSLGSTQQAALSLSAHSAFPLIQEWVEAEPEVASREHSFADLFAIIAERAKAKNFNFYWKNSQGFSQHIVAMEQILSSELGMQIITRRNKEKGRDQKFVKFSMFGDNASSDGRFTISLKREYKGDKL